MCQVITGEIFTPREKLPEPGKNILKFKKWDHLFKSPLRIYADLECALVDRYETEGEGTMTYHNHEPIACSIRYVSEIPNLQFRPFNYRGPDAHKRLVKELKRVAFEIEKIPDLFAHHDPEELERFNNATSCFACGGEFVPDDINLRKVFDHCHWTGKYRSAMHSQYNLQCRRERNFPVFFHNLSKYDGNFLIRALNSFDDGKVSVLPGNEETYISITKEFNLFREAVPNGKEVDRKTTFNFKDSFLFIPYSLSEAAKSLSEEDYSLLKEYGEH